MVYLLSFIAFALAVGGLSVGMLAGREGIKGSCGGLSMSKSERCGVCGRAAVDECPRKRPT